MAEEYKVGFRTEADNQRTEAVLDRDSVLITRDWVIMEAKQGNLYHVQQGDAGTKLAFAETAYDEDQPQFALRIPTGVTLIPVRLAITLEDLAGTENHVFWSTTTNDIGNGTSTAATISNMRAQSGKNSGVTARSLYTANATAATGLIEVHRFYRPFASAAATDGFKPEDYIWDRLIHSNIPILDGPATLQAHIYGGTAPHGFGEYFFVAKPTTDTI